MAELKTPPPPSSSSLSPRENNKSHPFLLFIAFLFVFLLLLARPAHQIRHSNMVSEPITTQTLSASNPTTTTTTTTTPTSTLLRPKKTHHEKTLPSKQFEASDHEVPSGPNPISNR
ncbi:hypothetical protein SOVF_092920 [Spinacia oleracea]|nr:hypothetical protein SOVF_092920 [Spinacia oleracea]